MEVFVYYQLKQSEHAAYNLGSPVEIHSVGSDAKNLFNDLPEQDMNLETELSRELWEAVRRSYESQAWANAILDSGNDVQAVFADEDNYINWKNGHTGNVFYGTEMVTVPLPSVSYSFLRTHLLSSGNVAMLFKDRRLFVRRLTPAAMAVAQYYN